MRSCGIAIGDFGLDLSAGNRNLKPETSKSLNLGAVYSPTLAPNGFASALSIEADYHDIKVNKAISALDPNVTLTNCAIAGDPASLPASTGATFGAISNWRPAGC